MWISKKKIEDIENRIASIEQRINAWQSYDSEESKRILEDTIARFQSPNGAIRGSAPKSS